MKLKAFFESERTIKAFVFFVVCFFYAYYFREAIPYLNAKLATEGGDGIKNYYTYVFHIVNDTSAVNFNGMNYPYGEIFVYTDCQPILTLILRCLPFTHNYLIGILHFLMLFSFVITPNTLYSTFRIFDVNKFSSVLCAIAIGLLPPQLGRIGGHFALSYACLIPIILYFLAKYLKRESISAFYVLVVLNTLYFFIHPYLGFGTSVFSFFVVFFNNLLLKFFNPVKKEQLRAFMLLILPVLVFKLFISLMDAHSNRSTEPYGIDTFVASPSTVFVPTFGPFEPFLRILIKTNYRDWEGISYIGFLATITLPIALIFFFAIKHLRSEKTAMSLLITSSLLLFFSFGWLNDLLGAIGVDGGALKQFRALGRFAWFFYYGITLFLVITVHQLTINIANEKKYLRYLWPALFLIFNVIEGTDYLSMWSKGYLKVPNIFVAEYLNDVEKKLVEKVNSSNPQAIMPMPQYFVGSDMYGLGGDKSAYMSMLLSFHCNKPLMSSMMTRTSITETKNNIERLNLYKSNKPQLNLLNDEKISVIKLSEANVPSESRFLRKLKLADKVDNVELYYATREDFEEDEEIFNKNAFKFYTTDQQAIDTLGVYFLASKNEIPFITTSKTDDWISVLKFEKGQFPMNLYTLSFHYHYEKEKAEYLHTNVIVIKYDDENKETWQTVTSIQQASGFYNGFVVFEQFVQIDGNYRYNILLNTVGKQPFRISNVLFKPEKQDVILSNNSTGELLFNNFPRN